MSNIVKYKDYTAIIHFSVDDECLVGHIAGINDIVGFHGDNFAEIVAAFEEAVDDYLDTCAITGKTPEREYSGKLSLRLPPDIHSKAAIAAELSNKSINQWASDLVSKAVKSL